MALVNLSQEVNKQKGWIEALKVLARALEADPTSAVLWIVYLHIYYCNQKSIGNDDMFNYAVEHNGRSYELWLMYINSREQLEERLIAYDTALSALSHDASPDRDAVHASKCILDIFLQMMNTLCISSSSKLFSVSFSSPLPPLSSGSVGGENYIEHTVSRFDTLAGVAIKYGVEVSDIKKINGLVSDLQMFALKTLYIPQPGRHPPSPILTNGSDAQRPRNSEQTPPRRRHSDLFDSLQSLKLQSPNQKVSRAMHSLQGYYHLDSPDKKNGPEECEMALYQKGGSRCFEDGLFGKSSSCMNQPLSKNKSIANGFKLENGVIADDVSVPESDNWFSNLVRRRPKSENDFTSCTSEKLLKEDLSSNIFSVLAGKGLALRLKAAGRTVSGTDVETVTQNSVSTAVGDFSLVNGLSGVKKSFSTPSLQDSDNSSSIWPTVNWSLKPDLQALSTAALTRPIFDGLPKPITSRKNKTAVD